MYKQDFPMHWLLLQELSRLVSESCYELMASCITLLYLHFLHFLFPFLALQKKEEANLSFLG